MPKIGNCENCGDWDILGYMPCMNKNICPKCTSKVLYSTEAEARHELKCQMEGVANVS